MPIYVPDGQGIQREVIGIPVVAPDKVQRNVKEVWHTDSSGVGRLVYGSKPRPLGELSVGSIVVDSGSTYYDVPIRWIVGDRQEQGIVKLVSERIISFKCFDAKEPSNPSFTESKFGYNRYVLSNIDQWLNSAADAGAWYSARHAYDAPPIAENTSDGNAYDTERGFLCNLSSNLRSFLLEANILNPDSGSTVKRKVYLLSSTEINLKQEEDAVDGTIWEYFAGGENYKANPTKEAIEHAVNLTGLLPIQACHWKLRTSSANLTNKSFIYIVTYAGVLSTASTACLDSNGVRPAINLPADLLVTGYPDTTGAYVLQFDRQRRD